MQCPCRYESNSQLLARGPRFGRYEMLGYKYEDISRMQFTLNMAAFYLPPAQEELTIRLKEVHELLEGLLAEGYVNV